MKTLKLAFALPILSMFMGTAQAAITQDPDRVEVAFVLDTTGSMGDLIDGAKKKIWSIASTIVETNPDADVSMALVAYRDLGDDYVLQTTPLSEDIQGMYGKLVRLEAGGGGDTPESVNAALNEAVKKLQWTSGDHVKRIIFLVGDAPPHMDYQQERQYPEILKDADDRDIIVNAVEFDKVAEEELPKELQSQPKAERKAWLDQKLKERAALETEMEGLINKRDNFVVEENKKSTKNTSLDSFDRAVEDTLKVQLN